MPNITGSFGHLSFQLNTSGFTFADGAFKYPNKEKYGGTFEGVSNGTNISDGFSFNASSSDSTYSGSKLQPASLKLLACIRI